MNLVQIKTFLWVAKLGGFRRAAEKLHTSQPAISSRIAALEQSLGVSLLERSASGVQLTPKGRELLDYAEKLVQIAETARHRVGDPAAYSGVLRLGVSETIVHAWLSRFLAQLRERYPKINVDLSVDVSANLRDGLLARSIDLAFLMGPVSEFSVLNLELPAYEIGWFAGPEAAAVARDEGADAVFSRFPVISFARNTRPFSELKSALLERYGDVVSLFSSSSLAACFQMVRDGVGIGALPVALAEPWLQQGEVQTLAVDWQPSPLKFTASYVAAPTDLMVKDAAELAQEVAKSMVR